MKKFKIEMRRDGSYNEPAEKFSCDSAEITIYDSPDPRWLAESRREGKFYGARRTVHLTVTWEDDKPKVKVNGVIIPVK